MGIKRINNTPRLALQTEQKVAFVILLFLGIGGVFFGFRSFGAALYHPIQKQHAKYYTGEDLTGLQATDTQEMADLKKKDTDGDGLSDYDELYIYKTGPYLTDSDSDGIDDKTEVFTGTDPNCPTGRTCQLVLPTDQTEKSKTDSSSGAVSNKAITNSLGGSQFTSKEEIETFFKSASVQEIRDALIQSGQVTKEDVNKMSDVELKKFFDEAVTKASATGAFDSLINGTADSTTPAQPKSTSANSSPH